MDIHMNAQDAQPISSKSIEEDTKKLQHQLQSFQNSNFSSYGRSIPLEIFRLIQSPAATESILLSVMTDVYHIWIVRAALEGPNVTENVLMAAIQWSIKDRYKDYITPDMILSHPKCTESVKRTVHELTPRCIMNLILSKDVMPRLP